MARHRVMVRLAAELEDEHIEILRRKVYRPTDDEALARNLERSQRDRAFLLKPFDEQEKDRREHAVQRSVQHALNRELVARGLLEEARKPRPFAKPVAQGDKYGSEVFADKDLETHTSITSFGEMFLSYLRDPAPAPDEQ